MAFKGTIATHGRGRGIVVATAPRGQTGQISIIGGNVWLTRSVPPGSVVTQADSVGCG